MTTHRPTRRAHGRSSVDPRHDGTVRVPGGTYTMGADDGYPEEAPEREVTVEGVWMDRHPVTNAEFATFVEATGYETVAEHEGESAVFRQPDGPVDIRDPGSWWEQVAGADWRHPEGPGSDVEGRLDHPVVHVAHEDAEAYAEWAGKALPTEAEWERAARGGLEGEPFAWGGEFAPGGRPLANTWQGTFPWQNRETDGYARTSPVAAFPSNGYGLYDVAGNVWEWTADRAASDGGDPVAPCCTPPGELAPESQSTADGPARAWCVLKGGSYLCSPGHCTRYRPAARLTLPADAPAGHVGFRCLIRDVA